MSQGLMKPTNNVLGYNIPCIASKQAISIFYRGKMLNMNFRFYTRTKQKTITNNNNKYALYYNSS